MRMWMVDPKILCRKHLLGEHVEHHMFAGSINKGISMDGYVANNLIQTKDLLKRHDALVTEMLNRGYNHKSPLQPIDYSLIDTKYMSAVVDKEASLADLLNRCEDCRARYKTM